MYSYILLQKKRKEKEKSLYCNSTYLRRPRKSEPNISAEQTHSGGARASG